MLYLPPIVDAAESSPAAAAECARQIRKYLTKDYKSKTSWQYHAIMVMRILADNPGKSFTRNFDKKFVDVVRDLLKTNREPSVQQILMETLDVFEHTKADDENLAALITMWKGEKERAWSKAVCPPTRRADRHKTLLTQLDSASSYAARRAVPAVAAHAAVAKLLCPLPLQQEAPEPHRARQPPRRSPHLGRAPVSGRPEQPARGASEQ